MSEVTGPISTMPGSRHGPPDGAVCDVHSDRPAVARIQGETDSFGSEMHDLCGECIDQIREHRMAGHCDWCKRDSTALIAQRDYDEGLCGPVYYVCKPCRDRYRSELQEDTNR